MSIQQSIVHEIQLLKPHLSRQFHVTELSLFGSQARNEATTTSDVNLLVEFSDAASLFDLVRLKQYLEEKLHQPVDAVPKESLRAELREQVLKEAAPL